MTRIATFALLLFALVLPVAAVAQQPVQHAWYLHFEPETPDGTYTFQGASFTLYPGHGPGVFTKPDGSWFSAGGPPFAAPGGGTWIWVDIAAR